jgi:PAS domain S-box-containing protein
MSRLHRIQADAISADDPTVGLARLAQLTRELTELGHGGIDELIDAISTSEDALCSWSRRQESRGSLEQALSLSRRVDAIVSELGTRLLDDDAGLDADAVHGALGSLGELFGTDRSYVFEFSVDRQRMSNTFEWCAPGVHRVSDDLQELPTSSFPWLLDMLAGPDAINGPVINGPVAELPPAAEAERISLEAQGVTSLLIIPLRHREEAIGFVGFDQVTSIRDWTSEEINALRAIAAPLASAIARIRTTEQLRTGEERLRIFASTLHIGACIVDGSFEHGLYANPAFEALTGISVEEFAMNPRCALRIVHPDDVPELTRRLVSFLHSVADPDEAAPRLDHTCRIVVDDEVRWVRHTAFALDHDGRLRRIGALVEDITERQALQHELTAALQRAAGANQAKTDFLSRVSHELRTPLHGTLGFLELLRLEPDAADHHRYLESAERSCRQLVSLIDELLEVTRIEAGRIELQYALVDVTELITDVVALARSGARDLDVRLTSSLPSRPVLVRTDRRRLGQILANLVSNGIKYGRGGGHVEVRLLDHDDAVVVEVVDDGVGIAPDDLARLFVPFERLGAAGTDIEGSGIGLAVTRQLVTALGAEIDVDSSPGVGSTFTLRLPPEDRCGTCGGSHGRTGYSVLCVDDSASSLDVLGAALGRLSGVSLRTAGNLQDALTSAVVDRPDLVLLDRHLPDGDGLDAIGRFLALGDGGRPVRVVVITADTEPSTHELAIERGALRLFTKPLQLADLVGFVGSQASQASRGDDMDDMDDKDDKDDKDDMAVSS